MKTKMVSVLALLVNVIGFSQNIEKFSIDSGGTSVAFGGIEILYTIGEVNIQELSVGNIHVSEGFINGSMKIKIGPKLFLQGPIMNPNNAGLMNDDLRNSNYIPTTSPYADAVTCDASVFTTTGNNAIVDWVWVELRAANDNTKIINGKSALLQRDGDVVALDGVSEVIMTAAPTNYFVVVNHRNHLGAMSASTVSLNETTAISVNFTDSSFITYGSNAQAILGSGDTALWAGDINGNSQTRYLGPNNDSASLKTIISNAPGNTTSSNYYPYSAYNTGDINLDGIVRYLGPGNDKVLLKNIIINHPDNPSSNYYPISSQIPN